MDLWGLCITDTKRFCQLDIFGPPKQAMARFVAGSMAPKQDHAAMSSRGVASASRAPQPRTAAPPAEAVLADVQSVVESVLGAHVPTDQPLMQVVSV